MNPFAIPAAMSVFGAYLGYQGGKDQERYGRDQEKLAEENMLLGKRELQEEVRRQNIEDTKLRATAVARSAASGMRMDSGTIVSNMDYMEDEQERQMNWLKTAGASEIRLKYEAEKLGAEILQDRGKNQQWSSLISGAVSVFGYADAGGMFESNPASTTLTSPYAKSSSGSRITTGGGFQ